MVHDLQTTVIDWKALGVDPKIIVENSERVRGRFIPTAELKDEPCAVVAYGPSLQQTWEQVQPFRTIFTCSGAYKFLTDRGIIPTHHCESDPRPHKIRMLGRPYPGTTFLVASVINPNYLDALEAAKVRINLWHILFEENAVYDLIPKGDWIICGGQTIGPRTIKLARLSGFTNIHCFGFDGSGGHAGDHTNAPSPDKYSDLDIRGETFRITQNLLMQTHWMFEDLDRMPETHATFHGEGLIQKMARERTSKKLERYPLAIQK